jgi:hypothetical protein
MASGKRAVYGYDWGLCALAVTHLCLSGGDGRDGLDSYSRIFGFVDGDVIADTYTFALRNRLCGSSITVAERGAQDGFHILCLHQGKGRHIGLELANLVAPNQCS